VKSFFLLFSASKKARWTLLSSDPVERRRGTDSATSSSIEPADSVSDSDVGCDRHACLRVAVIVTPIVGVCVLIPLVVVALRLLAGSERRQTRRPLVVPVLPPADVEKPDSCPLCGSPAALCLCPDSSPRTKFVVLTAAQPRRSPGGGYQQIVHLPTTTVPCCYCGRNTHPTHDAADRTAFQHDAYIDGEFV